MDAADFLNAFPDLKPILADDEDAKQDIALRCWEHRDGIRNLSSFARKAAKHARIGAARLRRRRPPSMPLDAMAAAIKAPSPSPVEHVLCEEAQGITAEIVRYFLGNLTYGQREAIEAVYLRGESRPEAAARLARSPAAVNSACARGMRKLRRCASSYETGRVFEE